MDDERGLNRCPATITVNGGYDEGWRFQCDRKVDHWFDGERHYSHDEMRGVDIVCFWADEESDLPKRIGPVLPRPSTLFEETFGQFIVSGSGTLFPGLIDDVFASKPLLWQIHSHDGQQHFHPGGLELHDHDS